MAEYTIVALVAPLAVVALELAVLRTGLFRDRRYWIALAIALAFQIPVDGWLTSGTPPVVAYDPAVVSGVYLPMRIPVEDFGMGFALITLTLVLWRRRLAREPDDD